MGWVGNEGVDINKGCKSRSLNLFTNKRTESRKVNFFIKVDTF